MAVAVGEAQRVLQPTTLVTSCLMPYFKQNLGMRLRVKNGPSCEVPEELLSGQIGIRPIEVSGYFFQ